MMRVHQKNSLLILILTLSLNACGGTLSMGEFLSGGQVGFAADTSLTDDVDVSEEDLESLDAPLSGSHAADEALSESDADLDYDLSVQSLPVTIAKGDEEVTPVECDADNFEAITLTPDSAEMRTFPAAASSSFKGQSLKQIASFVLSKSETEKSNIEESVFFVGGESLDEDDITAEVCDVVIVNGETEYTWRSLSAAELSDFEMELGHVKVSKSKLRLSDTYTHATFQNGEKNLRVRAGDFGGFTEDAGDEIRYIVLRRASL